MCSLFLAISIILVVFRSAGTLDPPPPFPLPRLTLHSQTPRQDRVKTNYFAFEVQIKVVKVMFCC